MSAGSARAWADGIARRCRALEKRARELERQARALDGGDADDGVDEDWLAMQPQETRTAAATDADTEGLV